MPQVVWQQNNSVLDRVRIVVESVRRRPRTVLAFNRCDRRCQVHIEASSTVIAAQRRIDEHERSGPQLVQPGPALVHPVPDKGPPPVVWLQPPLRLSDRHGAYLITMRPSCL